MSAESDLLLHCGTENLPFAADFGELDKQLLSEDLFEGVPVPDFNFEEGDFFKPSAISDDKVPLWNGEHTQKQENVLANDESEENTEIMHQRMHRLSLDTIEKTTSPALPFLQFPESKTEPETTSPVLLGYPDGITSGYASVNYNSRAIVSSNHVPLVSAPLNISHSSAEVLSSAEELLLEDAKDVSPGVQFSCVPRSGSAIDLASFAQKAGASEDSLSPLPTHLQRPSLMQRSFSSHSLGQLRANHGFGETSSFHPQFSPIYSSVMEVPITESRLQTQASDLHGVNLRSSFKPMRRACSTGDIQKINGMHMSHGSGSPLMSEASSFDEAGFKIGRYNAEERKQRIYRYRKKRNERNFNKKIKYACRKTLADSRPRVRGRFARNEDAGDAAAKSHQDEDDDEEADAVHDDDEDFMINNKAAIHAGEITGIMPLNTGYTFLRFSS